MIRHTKTSRKYSVYRNCVLFVVLLAAICFSSVLPARAIVGGDGTDNASTSVVTEANDCSAATSPEQLNASNCGIINYIVVFTNALSAIVGVVIVLSLVIAGLQYSSAKSDPQAVAKAKQRIMNALIALFVFIFMYAFLQWLVPGGIF